MEIVLYQNYYLRPDNNKVIDDITTFLENTSRTIETTNYTSQYLKPALEYEIKVERLLTAATNPQIKNTSFFNYAWLKYLGFPVFCFVLSSEWISEKTIKLKLKVDVLNTYHYSKLSISPRTFIHRQHKNRYDENRKRIIDVNSECLQFPLVAKNKFKTIIQGNGQISSNFYLVFKSPVPPTGDVMPDDIYCEICADYPIDTISATFSELNLADTRLLKIIQLPYCPTPDIVWNGTYFEIQGHTNNYEYIGVDQLYRIKDTSIFTKGTPNNLIAAPAIDAHCGYNPTYQLPLADITYKAFAKKYEPKLFHSDFFVYKYFYDSFSKQIKLEQLDTSERTIPIDFRMTQNVTSKFLFKFNASFKYYDEDYAEYLTIARNNERTIYTNAFLDYLQTGYNYDVKNKERAEIFKGLSTGLSLAPSISKMAEGDTLEGGIGIANSLLGAINYKMASDSAFEEKLHTLKMQGSSVLNADDIDLLEIYNTNKLCYNVYELHDKDSQYLLNLFHYNGYREENYGIPDFTSRKFFNYVSCELVIDQMPFGFEVANYEAFKELAQKYKEGVYIIHKYTQNNQAKWDVKMEYENWETFLPFTE